MTPTVGRIVHYHTARGVRPAIITSVQADGFVNCQVVVDPEDAIALGQTTGTLSARAVPFGPAQNQWSWPPRDVPHETLGADDEGL